ncbi:uncharacterized protein [Nicotiana tomentosiformis]|uniref:uncharacterized protein n=1 Tax=Nicotiana tomentosiformis TaxID=4098 RepID=UPI00388CCA07
MAHRWWQSYLLGRLADSPPMTWDRFTRVSLDRYILPSQREELRFPFEQLQHGPMSVTDYEARFSELSRHALMILPTDTERVQKFVAGFHTGIQATMAREVEIGTSYELVVEIARRIKDFHAKIVTLAMPQLPRLEWKGSSVSASSRVVSFLKARHMVEKGCLAYLAYVRDTTAETPTIDSVPVVWEFSNVFSSDLPGMPPNRDIDFCIDLAPGTQPISIPSYSMALKELKQLKEQL